MNRAELNQAREEVINRLKPLIKPATKITVKKPLPEIPDGTELQSHFGGQPYFEKGEQWPLTKDGAKLDFVFQIFNEDGIALPDYVKLVQFYYDFDIAPWGYEDERDGWLVKVYETLNTENVCIITNTESDRYGEYYCEIEFEPIPSIPDWQDMDDYDDDIKKLKDTLAEKDRRVLKKIMKELAVDRRYCSQLGGYPDWIQGGITLKENFDFLFQIDEEPHAGLFWCDCGMVYAFYNRITKETKFKLQCC
jgi:uncharacterized protein YwqG